ncbi:hypothetical protein [Paenibacillus sp. 22594]|uniref:hypothetical protein n=1 Tax=Paenibacillus sp. 22594 TaxID=3453947 RepID=UPI003F8374F3
MITERIGLKMIAIGLLLVFVLTACGNEQTKIVDERSSIMAEVEFVLIRGSEKPKDESSIKFIREMSEFIENQKDKESFLKIADLLDQEDYEEVEKIYKELGGEIVRPSAKPSKLEVLAQDKDKDFAALSLEAAELYIDATFDVEQDSLDEIAALIRKNTVLVKTENQEAFNELADYIENDERSSAESLFLELQEKYNE